MLDFIKNKPIYILPYNAKLNPIENFFSQIMLKIQVNFNLKLITLFFVCPATYDELQITINDIIKTKINKKHLKNYFKYLFI